MQRVQTKTAAQDLPAYSADGTPGYFRNGDAVAAIPPTVPGAQWFNMVQEELRNLVVAAGLTPSATDDTQLAQAVAALIADQAVTVQAATETVAGILKLATQAQVDAGDGGGAVTPETLATRLAALLVAATQTQAGLVRLSTPAEILAGSPNVVVTAGDILARILGAGGSGAADYIAIPYRDKSTGELKRIIIQWGRVSGADIGGTQEIPIIFPMAFPSAIYGLFPAVCLTGGFTVMAAIKGEPTLTGASIVLSESAAVVQSGLFFYYFAIGH
ncbi:hypothetical protein JMF94_14890 [Desulfovibrio sp. UIB00]|uniref:gp53-like domain-containing protein n=1 Tax=Desulfovibrio sp. UIB00 TaxID=2804314 RepID=UPI001F10ABB3|nr:hypothetical protein [Desulfovibrio sp. UIB00]MCH5146367.1 hypothetical protein [Desulfovibrio sp. UIB00]